MCECGCGQPAPIAARTNRRQGTTKGEPQRFILGHCLRGPKTGAANHNWKGGRSAMANGYIMLYAPESANADKRGYVLEHVRLAELALGRPLPKGAEIHHFDENPANNAPGNLVLCENRKYHALLHKRKRALDACGNASALRCYFCHGYDNQTDIYTTSQNKTRHRSCERAWQRARKSA